MSAPRICEICGQKFTPDKKHPYQIYCSAPGCQKERRKQYFKRYGRVWRRLNPNYSKIYWSNYKKPDREK